jgi:hypothetical protein
MVHSESETQHQVDGSCSSDSSVSGDLEYARDQSNVMNKRYFDFIDEVLPEFDLTRMKTNQSREKLRIDFAPECSHNSYLHALYH